MRLVYLGAVERRTFELHIFEELNWKRRKVKECTHMGIGGLLFCLIRLLVIEKLD